MRLTLLAGLACAFFLTMPGLAQDDPSEKYSKPGKMHALLAKRVGTWKAQGQFYMKPDQPPVKSDGMMVRKMIMGGRFLEEKYSAKFFGSPFEGLSTTGYDQAKKKFVSTWIDNMSTSMMIGAGTYDPKTKTMTFFSAQLDPATGKAAKIRSVTRLIAADKEEFAMYRQLPDNKEVTMMKIIYTRQSK